jgi:hypothetical protein
MTKLRIWQSASKDVKYVYGKAIPFSVDTVDQALAEKRRMLENARPGTYEKSW